MIKYVAVGLATVAGAALLEVAVVPALAIGGAALLAPAVLPKLHRQVQPVIDALVRPRPAPARPLASAGDKARPPLIARLAVKQALAKTVTFRIIVTSLDFTTNYIVLGELTTAAGLSTINLIAGPIFYFAHETVWNHLRPANSAVDLPALPAPDNGSAAGWRRIKIDRALAKTITFRSIASVMDFTTNYVVVGDAATALGLSAAGLILGPFVYWGHERVWDHFSVPRTTLENPTSAAS